MSQYSLAGVAVTNLRASIPAYGCAWFDVTLAEAAVFSAGPQSLKIADKTYAVSVVHGGVVDGTARYRCVAGFGGWRQPLPKKASHNDAGVKVSSLVREAADAVGERVGTLPDTRVGPHWSRDAGRPASWVLHAVAPNNWYVDDAGVTQIGQRPSVVYSGGGIRTRKDLAAGVVEITTETLDTLAPGAIVDGNAPATDLEIVGDANKMVVRVYFAPVIDRTLDAFRKIFDALYPQIKYCGVWEYRVVSQDGERLNLQPVRTASGMPDLERVPVRPGVSGWRADVTLGEVVLVAFADQSPARPQVIAHEAADSPGWLPTLCEFGDGDFLAQKTAIDTLQHAFDTHTHPYFLGPVPGPTTPVGPLPSCEKLKGE